jgi:hypothetical protein
MKKTLQYLTFVLGGAVLIAGCAGADSTSRPAVASLAQGLTMFNDNAAIVSGAYVQGDRAIFFETRRGPETSDAYQQLGMPKFEMDVRVLDENGRTVYLQAGGDQYVDPSWDKDLAAEAKLAPVDPVVRAGSFALMKEVVPLLQKVQMPASMIHEMGALTTMHLVVKDNMLPGAVAAAIKETGYTPGTNAFELHGMCIFACFGDHSATVTNISGTVRVSCNHGTCASSMGQWCTGGGTGGVDYHEYNGGTGVASPGCTTPYNWDSGGNHNCHDDSVRQMWGMQYGSQGGSTSGVCNNSATHWKGPSCNTTSW